MSGVAVDFDGGRASLEAKHVPIFDYGMIANALFAGGPAPVRGSVSFKVVWSGPGEKVNIRNKDPIYGGFEGEFIRNSAQMEWTGRVDDLKFESDPLATSSSSFAQIGQERNGIYFK